MNKLIMIVVSGIFAFSSSTSIQAANISAQEIVEKASLSSYYGGNDGRTSVRMMIVDANGRKQTRQFSMLRKDLADGGEQKFLVVFSRPTDISGTVFMVHKKPLGEDDRWLYLPALDLVKRISAGDKRTSFVGAHYYYEDVSGRSPYEDQHELLEETEEFYILKHTPKQPESVEFRYYKSWINKTNYLPAKVEFYDATGKAYRLIETLNIASIQDIPTVTKARVTNLYDNSYTLMEFREMTYNIDIPEDLFTERALRNPPVKWLKSN